MLVIERAHAKINLALHIKGRRADGYHELESVVAFADVADVLTISPAARVSLDITGPFADGLPRDERNSVIAAWRQLDIFSRQSGAALAPVKFHLEKNLPVAAGIGGGSADTAAALRGLIRLFGISVSAQDMKEIALKLGADVSVCLGQKASRMRGIGEIIEPIAVSLPRAVLLVNPRVPLPTPGVFESLKLECGQSFGTAISDLSDIKNWRNDLTAPAITIVPEIASVLESLGSQKDIICSRMSGSGATCFGLVENLAQAERAAISIKNRHTDWWVIATTIL